jgi:ferredoxin
VTLHIDIDGEVCMGSGNCVFEAPGVFELGDDSVATVVDPAAAPAERVHDAARKCPSRAIHVTDRVAGGTT